MYICNDCGAVFEEPKIEYEHHPYGMGTAKEEWWYCPHCDSTDFEEAEECEYCGECFPKSSLRKGLCDLCYEDMYE